MPLATQKPGRKPGSASTAPKFASRSCPPTKSASWPAPPLKPLPQEVPMQTSTLARVLDRSLVEQIVREVIIKRVGSRPPDAAPTLAVHASARHMHVSRADLDILYGPGHE